MQNAREKLGNWRRGKCVQLIVFLLRSDDPSYSFTLLDQTAVLWFLWYIAPENGPRLARLSPGNSASATDALSERIECELELDSDDGAGRHLALQGNFLTDSLSAHYSFLE